jgi:hypothetical protein
MMGIRLIKHEAVPKLRQLRSPVRGRPALAPWRAALIQKGCLLLVYCTDSRCSHSSVTWPDGLRSGRNKSATTTIAFNVSQLPTKIHKPVMAFLQGFPLAFVFSERPWKNAGPLNWLRPWNLPKASFLGHQAPYQQVSNPSQCN